MTFYQFGQLYKIIPVMNACYSKISSLLNIQNIFEIYEFATINHGYSLMYKCWKLLDREWSEIFQRPEYLRCSKLTISSLVLRPINHSVNEFQLFEIVLNWARNNVSYNRNLRSVIQPFLSRIRFLAMGFTCFTMQVIPLVRGTVLRDEEIEAIIRCFNGADVSTLPQTLCKENRVRESRFYITLFTYHNKYPGNIQKYISMKKNVKFKCKISVRNNCFVYKSRLPIKHSKSSPLRLHLNYVKLGIERKLNMKYFCDNDGHAYLVPAVYIRECSVFEYTATIDESELIAENEIQIKPYADYFLTFEEYERISAIKTEEDKEKAIQNFYFEFDLYF
ncbi:uncharacterized protein [Centruroides vittatus]|uniref:uncharacterized protein n=1 Tax=Centruroides vittatus TaxID=120091 RepID=UPI0035100971